MEQQPLKAVVTVTEMARMCGLSRARFYQLIGEGIFPQPSRNEQTLRPFYDQEQQQQCLLVRRTNRGVNGKVTIFYGCLPKEMLPPSKLPAAKRNLRGRIISKKDQRIVELRHGLTQLGITNVSDLNIQQALTEIYPDGWEGIQPSEVLRSAFNHLRNSKPT